MLLRPSAGFAIIRGRSSEATNENKSPWYGFIWAGIGFSIRSGEFSVSLDASAEYGSNDTGGSLGDSFQTIYGAVIDMFQATSSLRFKFLQIH